MLEFAGDAESALNAAQTGNAGNDPNLAIVVNAGNVGSSTNAVDVQN